MGRRFDKVTRTAVRGLKPGEALHEHGIVVERLQNGDCRFSVNIMVDRERIHRVIGLESEGVTREQAERAIESLRTRAREGRLDLPTGRKVHRTFKDAAEDYLTRIEHHPKHGRNMKAKRHHIRNRLSPYFKSQRPDRLTDFALAHYVRHRRSEGASDATINREMSTLSHFLTRCLEWGWMTKKLKVPKNDEKRKKIVTLTSVDLCALMQAAIADQDPSTWLFVAIAMQTGMRHSEILRIRWDDINIEARRIFVGKAKAGQREQPISEALATMLERERKQRVDQEGWIFPTSTTRAKHPCRQSMAEQFKRSVERAKLNPAKVTPHVLRHTAITGLVRAGIDLPTIQKISGHKTLAMVLRYTHLSDEHIDQAIANLGISFPDAITPELHEEADDDERSTA